MSLWQNFYCWMIFYFTAMNFNTYKLGSTAHTTLILFMGLFSLATPLCELSQAQAAVVMTGTRVIFPAQQLEKTIQLNNKDDSPSLVQIWIDAGDENSKAENSDAPFLLNPQVFKMQAQQGQIVRILFNGDPGTLPSDRESIFYLNFSEIPAIKDSDANKNKLLVVFKNRLKLFYRPQGLSGSINDMPKQLSYEIKSQTKAGLEIQINNDSAYHANIAQVSLSVNGKEIATDYSRLIAPKSNIVWTIAPFTTALHENSSISIALINDYGSTLIQPLPLRHH